MGVLDHAERLESLDRIRRRQAALQDAAKRSATAPMEAFRQTEERLLKNKQTEDWGPVDAAEGFTQAITHRKSLRDARPVTPDLKPKTVKKDASHADWHARTSGGLRKSAFQRTKATSTRKRLVQTPNVSNVHRSRRSFFENQSRAIEFVRSQSASLVLEERAIQYEWDFIGTAVPSPYRNNGDPAQRGVISRAGSPLGRGRSLLPPRAQTTALEGRKAGSRRRQTAPADLRDVGREVRKAAPQGKAAARRAEQIRRVQAKIDSIKASVVDGVDDEYSLAAAASCSRLMAGAGAPSRASSSAGSLFSLNNEDFGCFPQRERSDGGMSPPVDIVSTSFNDALVGFDQLSNLPAGRLRGPAEWAAAVDDEEPLPSLLSARRMLPAVGLLPRGSPERGRRPPPPTQEPPPEAAAVGSGQMKRRDSSGRVLVSQIGLRQQPADLSSGGTGSRPSSRELPPWNPSSRPTSREGLPSSRQSGSREGSREQLQPAGGSRPGSREAIAAAAAGLAAAVAGSRPGSKAGTVGSDEPSAGGASGSSRSPSRERRPGSGWRSRPGSSESLARPGSVGSLGLGEPPRVLTAEESRRAATAGPPGSAAAFFGADARASFFELFRAEADAVRSEGEAAPLLDSARRVYLEKCQRSQLNPWPLLVKAEAAERVVDMSSYVLGDRMAVAYAKGFVRMMRQGVEVVELNLAENALSAVGVAAIAEAVASCASLTTLDLRGNQPGRAGTAALGPVLRDHGSLTTLRLSKIKLGDRNAQVLLLNLQVHPTLTELDMSSNALGDSFGFGEACAEFLVVNEGVTLLNLAWNNIRAGNAEALAGGLVENSTLEYLDLQWNSVSDRGGCAFGRALRFNKGLQELDLTHNSVGEKGTMVLADAIVENTTLHQCQLDENPIGPRGGKAVIRAFAALALLGRDTEIDVRGCNFDLADPSKSLMISPNGVEDFDRTEPGGTWTCDLSKPFERMVANELVDLAWKEEGENWKDETLDGHNFELPEPPPGETWTRADYMLPEGGVLKVTYISTKRTPKMSDIMSGAMFSAMTRLTKKFAADARRPVLEVQLVPGRLHDQQALREHYNVFGRVSLIELVKFIDGAGFTPAPHEDATHAFVHFRDPDTAENALEDGSSLPAAAGAEPVSLEVKWASEESVSEEKMVQLLRISAAEACFSCRQVSELVDMFLDSDWRVDVLSFLMPKTVDLPNWNSQVLDYMDPDEFKTIEAKLGLLFYFTPPNPTGHYQLQLHNPIERIIINKLVEISIEERKARRPSEVHNPDSKMVNTSQKGDWDNWRNEKIDLMDGSGLVKYDFDERRPWHLPAFGLLEFDYVSTNANHRAVNTPEMNGGQFKALKEDFEEVWESVTVGEKEVKKKARRRFRRASVGVMAVGIAQDEGTHAVHSGDGEDGEPPRKRNRPKFAERRAWAIPGQRVRVRLEVTVDSDGDDDEEEQSELRAELVCQRLLLMLRRSTMELYFSSDQVIELLKLIPTAGHVEALVTLFSRITDLENHRQYDLLLKAASADDATEAELAQLVRKDRDEVLRRQKEEREENYMIYRERIGFANIFNPFATDLRYTLNLKKADERSVADLLVRLTDEPGENWLEETYNGMPFEMSIGWVEDGAPPIGVLDLVFKTYKGTCWAFLRCELARNLLMPGRGRWRCIPEALLEPGQDPGELDGVDDCTKWDAYELKFDGTLQLKSP